MIIALTGLAGSGKNTVADFTGFEQLAFAEPMKRFCAEVFDFSHEELYGPSEARESPSKTFKRPDGTPLTARYALQTLGTEWGRNCDVDVWAKACIMRAKALAAVGKDTIVTDLRFVNEAKAVRDAGGFVWRVHRQMRYGPFEPQAHASEREIYTPEMDRLVDFTIFNFFDLTALKEATDDAINDFRKGANCGH